MGKSLKKRSLKPQLKWKCLVGDGYMSIYEMHGVRLLLSITIGMIPGIVGLAATFGGGPLLLGIPFLLLTLFIIVGWGVFGYKFPEFHWLHDMDHDQEKALEWYDTLTNAERKQLPNGWDTMIREAGTESTDGEYYSSNVAHEQLLLAQEVVRLFNVKNEIPKVPDYRIDTYRQMLEERKQELADDIKSQRAIEKKIARMP